MLVGEHLPEREYDGEADSTDGELVAVDVNLGVWGPDHRPGGLYHHLLYDLPAGGQLRDLLQTQPALPQLSLSTLSQQGRAQEAHPAQRGQDWGKDWDQDWGQDWNQDEGQNWGQDWEGERGRVLFAPLLSLPELQQLLVSPVLQETQAEQGEMSLQQMVIYQFSVFQLHCDLNKTKIN